MASDHHVGSGETVKTGTSIYDLYPEPPVTRHLNLSAVLRTWCGQAAILLLGWLNRVTR